MKKAFFALAAAALMLGMTSCQKDEIIVSDPTVNPLANPLVKSASDLIGTEWEYTYDFSASIDSAELAALYDCMDSADVEAMFSMTFGLTFDTNYAHLTFPEDVEGWSVVDDGTDFTVEQVTGMDYTYTYTLATLSGTLTGGNLDTLVIPFTYDAANDDIIVTLTIDEGDGTTSTMTLVFNRAN